MPFEAGFLFDELFTSIVSASPNEDFDIFSFECVLMKLNVEIPAIYMKVINTLVFLLILYLLLLIAKVIKNILKKRRGRRIKFFSEFVAVLKITFFVYFNDNIILIFNSLVPLLICVDVDSNSDDLRVIRSPNIFCWEGMHKNFTLIFVVPIMFLFGIALPVIMAFKVKKYSNPDLREKTTESFKLKKFIAPYRKKRELYGVVLICIKIYAVIFPSHINIFLIAPKISSSLVKCNPLKFQIFHSKI